MPQYKVKSVDKITHNVLSIVTEKPHSFKFISGQVTDVSINKNG
jgi:ferredoxin-NADP reductase